MIRAPRLAAFAVLAMLAACGGSGGGDTAAAPPPALASGQLDPSYGIGGKASTTYSGYPRMTVGADGSVYVTSNAILKLGGIGEPVATHVLPNPEPYIISSPVVDDSGNVYVVYGSGIAKVDLEGRLATSFGTNGVAMHPSWDAGYWRFLSRIARSADGSLYLAGTKAGADESIHWMAVAKFDRDGRVDTAFGSMGMRILEFSSQAFVRDIALDRSGSVFLAGDARDGSLVVVKLDAEGKLAADFASGGIWRGTACNSPEGATVIAADAAGSILVAGRCAVAGTRGAARVFKLDSHGVVVPSFREGGLRSGLFGVDADGTEPASFLSAVLVNASGEIYAAGSKGEWASTCYEVGGDFAVAKLDGNGDPVRAFGSSGVAVLDSGNDFGSDAGLDRAGRLYVGGGSLNCSAQRSPSISYVVFRLGG